MIFDKKDLCLSDGFIDQPSHIAGNEEVITCIYNLLNARFVTPKIHLAGPSGSGKSSITNCCIKLFACRNPAGGKPCGECYPCRKCPQRESNYGLFAAENSRGDRVNYIHINCRNATQLSVHDALEDFEGIAGVKIIHLEEVDHLAKYKCDLSITETMDSPRYRDCKWIATSVTDTKLDFQFRRRWGVKLVTEKPSLHDAAECIHRVCHDLRLTVEDPAIITDMVTRSKHVMAVAFGVIEQAALMGSTITRRIVNQYPFPVHDPWKQDFFQVDS